MAVQGESVWKLSLGTVALIFFFGIGVGHILYPGYFLKRSAIRKGGEMLTNFNLGSLQIVAALVAGFAAYVLYEVAKDVFCR